jgi:endonuclease/exonuclease/phosphatase family metal-dependent hydrolase
MGLRRGLTIAAGTALAASAGAAGWVRSLLWFPDDIETIEVTCEARAERLTRGKVLKVLVWNVQYSGSRNYHFFYDGGQDVHVTRGHVVETMDAIADVVRELDPDLILWQELDRGSARTSRIDQHAELLRRVPYPCHTTTPYHRVGYVPTPSQQHLGKVDMHLAVWSKYEISSARRIQLALLDEPAWRQWFNLRRALLDVRLPLDDGGELRVMNTHLSAFSNRDGTLRKQIAKLHAEATESETAGVPWVLGGDFNALPPGDDPSRLGEQGAAAYDPDTPIQLFFDRFDSLVPEVGYRNEPERWRTYLPPGSDVADRTLDYVFAGRTVATGHPEVLDHPRISDHLPLAFELTVETK